jgi:hypothetical protein
MAITKRNIKEIGESLDNMGKNDRPSILNANPIQQEPEKQVSKGGRKRKSYWTADERKTRTSVATYLNKEELLLLKMKCLADDIPQENLLYDILMNYLKK